jgi:hypothetical protein
LTISSRSGRSRATFKNSSWLGFTDTRDLSFLQDTKKAGLDTEGNIADFIQKEHSAVGCFKQTLGIRHSAREGSAPVSEQLAFYQRLGQAGTINGNERPVVAVTSGVDASGDKFLSSPSLAFD